MAPDPLDELEATLQEARRRAEELKSDSDEVQAERLGVRRFMEELADAVQDAQWASYWRE